MLYVYTWVPQYIEISEEYAVKKVLIVLLVILLVLALAAGAGYGLAWYRSNHIFIQGDAYPLTATELDLRDKSLTVSEFDQIQSQLPQCRITWYVPFQGRSYESSTTTMKVTEISQSDLDFLSTYFPRLSSLDASDCDEYDLLEGFQQAHPSCQVTYQVRVGSKSFAPDTTELTLENEDFDYDLLMENLPHLPEVTAITLKKTELSLEQIDALRQAYESIAIRCTVEILGTEYDTETTELNLSSLTSQDIPTIGEKLAMLPGLTSVELMNGEGTSSLSTEDVKALMEKAPEVTFHYTFDFFGTTLSTADEEVEIKNQSIGDENEAKVRLALDLLPNCKRFVLDNCKLSNEVMSQIREDYRDRTKVVWRVWFGKGSSLTDVELMRVVGDLFDSNSQDMIYCEDVVAIDIGHNEYLTDATFIGGMVNLEYCIISGSPIKTLEPFSNCKKLKFLEIAFCGYIEDLTPLAQCENLEMLNVSDTKVTDLSPLDDLPMTHLCAKRNATGRSRVSSEEQARFKEQHPDCWATFNEDTQPYGKGWRYDEDGITPLPYYKQIRQWFLYDLDPKEPNHMGYYFDTYAHLNK